MSVLSIMITAWQNKKYLGYDGKYKKSVKKSPVFSVAVKGGRWAYVKRTQTHSPRCLSQTPLVKDREPGNKHDFKIYNIDAVSSGVRINPIDFSARGEGRAGAGGQRVSQGQGLTL